MKCTHSRWATRKLLASKNRRPIIGRPRIDYRANEIAGEEKLKSMKSRIFIIDTAGLVAPLACLLFAMATEAHREMG